MRSRYTAYATGAAGHILNTTHPRGPHHQANSAQWRASVLAFCDATEFHGLTVHDATINGERGEVHFTAHLVQDGREATLEERSAFVRVDGVWLYHSALTLT